MSTFYLWIPAEREQPTEAVLRVMQNALRVHPDQKAFEWNLNGLGVGLLDFDPCAKESAPAPVITGRSTLWVIGEIFDCGSFSSETGPDSSRSPELRQRLIEALDSHSTDRLASLDGEYVLIHWSSESRRLLLANDRFGGLPVYWTATREGVAMAGGVRGVLAAPSAEASPDPEAIREAVTFGGFRLGDRTNMLQVKMLPGGSVVTADGREARSRRYWSYKDIVPRTVRQRVELLDEAHALWARATRLRLDDCRHPGQTLSGGLDSRAILAEAAPSRPSWVAVTYGIPGCDDARFAERAARAAGVRWRFHDLYESPDGWLTSRRQHIQETDGLIELGDLMHVETIRIQLEEGIHVHHSGYIGDAVCGPTFGDVEQPEDLYRSLPYYGTELGMAPDTAHERILKMVADLEGAPVRFALFEHKLPQSTNRWTAAWRPWMRVRKPFVDYRLFDFWQSLPVALRVEGRLYERMLWRSYPTLFQAIPNQKTGAPILSSRWRHQAGRVRRFAARKLRQRLGLPVASRLYRDDRRHCGPLARAEIEETILAPDSLCCAILNRQAVKEVVDAWFSRGAAPEQVIGALYVYESYHRDVHSHLRDARRNAREL